MDGAPDRKTDSDYAQFLLEALISRSSRSLVLVSDEATAASVALRVHAGALDDWPPGRAGLLKFDTAAIADIDADQVQSICRNLIDNGHWAFLANVDRMLDSFGGRLLFDAILNAIANDELSAVIASVEPQNYERLQSEGLRLLSFA